MNTHKASECWNISQKIVTQRCREGLVPYAEKRNIGWYIPDDAVKPIISGHKALVLLKSITIIAEGGSPKMPEDALDSYRFLADIGFCTRIKNYEKNNVVGMIRNLKVTSEGERFINLRQKSENGKKVQKTQGIKVGVPDVVEYYQEKTIGP